MIPAHGPYRTQHPYTCGSPESYSDGKGESWTDPIHLLREYAAKDRAMVFYCQQCNKPYIVHSNYTNTTQCLQCSGDRSSWGTKRVAILVKKNCEICGSEFMTTPKNKNCCSQKCRDEKYRRAAVKYAAKCRE